MKKLFIKLIINKFTKYIDNMKGSWKTSLIGYLTLVGVVIYSVGIPILDGDPATKVDLQSLAEALRQIWPAIPLGILGIFTRDKNVSTEAQKAAGTKMQP